MHNIRLVIPAKFIKPEKTGEVLSRFSNDVVDVNTKVKNFFIMNIIAHNNKFKFNIFLTLKDPHKFNQPSLLASGDQTIHKKKYFHSLVYMFNNDEKNSNKPC
jgi:hypothetical protein